MDDYFFTTRPAFPWSLEPLGLPAFFAVAALLVFLTIWTYVGHPQATRQRVLIVLVLRLAALCVALITAIRPSLGVNENPKQPGTLLIGVDVSESMTTKDGIGGLSRIDSVRKILDKCQPIFEEMLTEQNVNVVIYTFGDPNFNEATNRYEPNVVANAKRSDYGAYFHRTFERWQAEPRVRGHIVIGDFIDNGERYSAINEAARFGRRGIPVHGVLVGEESSGSSVKDIALTALECNPSPAFVKNKVTITAKVNAYNFPGAAVTARVFINDEPKWREDFVLEGEKNDLKMVVPTPDEKGEYKVRVEVGLDKNDTIEPLPGELDGANNRLETYLTVQKEGVRVLIVDQLRWEETFLRDALRGEPRFDVYEVLLQANFAAPDSAKKFLDLEAQAYDVVIIGDLGAAQLETASPQFLPKLTELALQKGVGVMFLGGENAYRGIPQTLLPISGDQLVDRLDPTTGAPRVGFPVVPTPIGLEKMFRVSGKPGEPPRAGASEELWNRLNNFRTGIKLNGYNRLVLTDQQRERFSVFAWTARLVGETVDPSDPAALVAGTNFDPKRHEPLLIGSERGDAGKSRWLAFGAFDTYLWRSLGQPKSNDGIQMHERFWRQCVLWLAYQDEEEGAVYARPQYRQLKMTQEQTVRVGIKKPDGTDDPDAPLQVRIVPLPAGAKEPNPADLAKAPPPTVLTETDRDGRPFRKVLFRAPAPGEYFVTVTGPVKKADGRTEEGQGTAKFIVIPDTSDEMLRINADPDFMQRVVAPTGGKALRLDELPSFLRQLKAESPPDMGVKPRYYPDWHRHRSGGFLPLWLVLFTTLLGAEWGLRRLWGMV